MTIPGVARVVWSLLTPAERRRASWLLVLMLAGMTFEAAGLGLIAPAIGLLATPERAAPPQFTAALRVATGWALGAPAVVVLVAIVIAYALKALTLGILAARRSAFAFGVQERLSKELFALYMSQPYVFHLNRNSADLIRNTLNSVGSFAEHGPLPLMTLMTEVLMLVSVVAVLVAVEPKGALSAFAALTLFGYVWQAKTRPRLQRAGDARLWSDALRLKQLQEGFGGAKDAKLLGREQQLIADYAIQSRAAADAAQTYDTLQQLPRLVLELGTVVVLAAVVVALLAAGRRPADVVVVIGVFAAAAFRLMPSFNRAVIALQTLHYDAATLALLEKELRELKPEPAPSSRTAMTLTDGVSLRNVSFTYPGASRPALRAVSLDVKARETVGFVGPSGAGKTTLAEIFVGLLSPDHGVVTVDGRPMQDSLRDWQSQVGFVPQSVFLTDGTIRSNVAFGLASSDIVEATVWRALAVAQMDAFVRSLPAGLETVIGERGVRLSGGQRQRLGIARALYNDPAVLVLDEATNALDDATETGVLEAVRALHGTRTIVVVAHRASTVGYCDRVFVFDEGRLCDDAGGVWRGPVVGGRAAATVTRSRS